uniref:Uncharacterized protein n=1 Tax=Ditylum brightwellii TaxID=49249 RepID=A0A7S4SE48_9STRA
MFIHQNFILAGLLSALVEIPVVASINPVIDCGIYELDTIHPLDTGIDYTTPLSLKDSQAGELCTLSRIIPPPSSSGNTMMVNVGRSYDGHSWERVAGLDDKLTYDCSNDS